MPSIPTRFCANHLRGRPITLPTRCAQVVSAESCPACRRSASRTCPTRCSRPLGRRASRSRTSTTICASRGATAARRGCSSALESGTEVDRACQLWRDAATFSAFVTSRRAIGSVLNCLFLNAALRAVVCCAACEIAEHRCKHAHCRNALSCYMVKTRRTDWHPVCTSKLSALELQCTSAAWEKSNCTLHVA